MTTTSTRVVVLGAGGRTGRLILDSALSSGHRAAALVRSPERAGLTAGEDLDVVAADAGDADALQRVLEPGDVIVSAIGPSGRKSNGLYTRVADAVVTAAGSDPYRFIGITSSGVRDDDPHHPWWYRAFMVPFMKNTYGDMRQMESILASSTLAWTFVRPGRLLDEPAAGDYRVEDGRNPAGGVSVPRADIADFVIACASSNQWAGKHPTIAR